MADCACEVEAGNAAQRNSLRQLLAINSAIGAGLLVALL